MTLYLKDPNVEPSDMFLRDMMVYILDRVSPGLEVWTPTELLLSFHQTIAI